MSQETPIGLQTKTAVKMSEDTHHSLTSILAHVSPESDLLHLLVPTSGIELLKTARRTEHAA